VKESLMLNIFVVSAAIAVLSGCSNGYSYGTPDKVIIDTLGVDPYEYQADLADCEEYAHQVSVSGKTAEGILEGAVVGGVLGAVLGNSDIAKRSAGAGGVLGGAEGNQRARYEQDRIVKRCLKGRGYRVLN
jgi:uncharacterized protein YcfJ